MIYSVQFGRWRVGLVSSPCDMGRHTGGELRTGHHGTDTRTTRPGITLTLQNGAEWNPAGLDNERIFTLEPYQDIPQQRVVRTGCRV